MRDVRGWISKTVRVLGSLVSETDDGSDSPWRLGSGYLGTYHPCLFYEIKAEYGILFPQLGTVECDNFRMMINQSLATFGRPRF